MRSLAALGLASLLACGAKPPPHPAAPAPTETIDVPPIASPPAPTPAAAEPASAEAEPRAEPAGDDVAAARAPAINRRGRRSEALIVTEIQQLDSLLASTPATAAARPSLMLRIAESYLELSRLQSGGPASASRTAALKLCADVSSTYPSFDRRDEAFYYAGLTSEEDGAFRDARLSYYEVIKDYPQSKYVPYAYFAFGEMFRNEVPREPAKAAIARQAYDEVLKYPETPILPWAKARLDALPQP